MGVTTRKGISLVLIITEYGFYKSEEIVKKSEVWAKRSENF